ncbi:MAG TPA: CRTAC1 family protein, partial [Abditibacterium sp.]
GSAAATAASTEAEAATLGFRFADVTQPAGIRFKHNNGAFGVMFLPETMGSGAAFIDYDGDGWQDIFFVNGRNWTAAELAAYKKSEMNAEEAEMLRAVNPNALSRFVRQIPPNKPARRTVGALYRNNRDGTFSDVTARSGLDIEMLGMGAAVGDYDNDGRPDLCVTSYGRNYLFRNLTAKSAAKGAVSQPKFREEAVLAGVKSADWSTCAAFLDYDKDGRLDLFVGRYLKWSPNTDIFRSLNKRTKSYGWPSHFKPQSSLLYHNEGGGRFRDVSARAGISAKLAKAGQSGRPLLGKALGVAVSDANNDNWPDIIVASDSAPNFYFVNQKNGTFSETAISSGLALSKAGRPRAGMGIDAADIDGSGRESVAIGHFNAEMLGLFHNQGGGVFSDIAPDSEVGQITTWFLTFGVLFADVDNDGRPDLLMANGHVDPDVAQVGPMVGYAERPLLFLNQSSPGQPKFHEVSAEAGAALAEKLVARGLAAADYDLDGDLDMLLTTSGGPPRLWRNDLSNQTKAVRLVLRGQRSNRSAIGASVEARVGNRIVRRVVRSGSSYLSQSELPLTLGVGKASKIDSLQIKWPSGKETRLQNIAANRIVEVDENAGLISQRTLQSPKK